MAGQRIVDVLSDAMPTLVDEDVACELLAPGFQSAEGPIWVANREYLLFSDIAGDNRRRWDERAGLRIVARPTGKANGMTLDGTGRLIVCEHVTSSLVAMDAEVRRGRRRLGVRRAGHRRCGRREPFMR